MRALHLIKVFTDLLEFTILLRLLISKILQALITFNLLLLNLSIVLPQPIDVLLSNLDLVLIEINVIANDLNLTANLLRFTFDGNHFLLLDFDSLLELVKLVG